MRDMTGHWHKIVDATEEGIGEITLNVIKGEEGFPLGEFWEIPDYEGVKLTPKSESKKEGE